jgi:hypothetical protein
MGDSEVHVNPEDLRRYAADLATSARDAAGNPRASLGQMTSATAEAFTTDMGGGVLAEGEMMAAAMQASISCFEQFVEDVGFGVEAITHAAGVCAATYRVTDKETADRLGLVDFAFAKDSAPRPPGLPTDAIPGETLEYQRDAAAREAPGTATPT